jgi:hypothetical protein
LVKSHKRQGINSTSAHPPLSSIKAMVAVVMELTHNYVNLYTSGGAPSYSISIKKVQTIILEQLMEMD